MAADDSRCRPRCETTKGAAANIGEDAIRQAAQRAGIEVPDGDLDRLTTALTAHVSSFNGLTVLELGGIDPSVPFDPRWDD